LKRRDRATPTPIGMMSGRVTGKIAASAITIIDPISMTGTIRMQPTKLKPISVPAPLPNVRDPHRVIRKITKQMTQITITSMAYNGDHERNGRT